MDILEVIIHKLDLFPLAMIELLVKRDFPAGGLRGEYSGDGDRVCSQGRTHTLWEEGSAVAFIVSPLPGAGAPLLTCRQPVPCGSAW